MNYQKLLLFPKEALLLLGDFATLLLLDQVQIQ
jgi:hypothetical protein